MEKIIVKIFGEADNYERVRDSMPDVFARIIALENKVNELIDLQNVKTIKPSPKELPTK